MIGAASQYGMKNMAAATILSVGFFPDTDFETRIKSAVGGNSFCVMKMSKSTNEGKPDEAGNFTNSRGAENANHFRIRYCTVYGFPIYGVDLLTDTRHVGFSFYDILVEQKTLFLDQCIGFRRKRIRA